MDKQMYKVMITEYMRREARKNIKHRLNNYKKI